MICVGIDVAKDKHDCFMMSSEGEVLANVFTVPNSKEGFEHLLQTINTCTGIGGSKIKVGLEATGYYSYNFLGFLLGNGLTTFVINPLHTNLYRKSQSLRKTKTDRVDARTIASMLMSDMSRKPYTNIAYRNSELKSRTRYRFDKVKERAALKSSVSWKNAVLVIYDTLFLMQPSLFVIGILCLPSILLKSVQKANITMLLFLMLPRSSSALFLLCKSPDNLTHLNPNFNKF